MERLVVSVEELWLGAPVRGSVGYKCDGGGVPVAVVGVVRRHGRLVHVDNVARPLGAHGRRSAEEEARVDEKW